MSKPVLRFPSDEYGDGYDICMQEIEEQLGYAVEPCPRCGDPCDPGETYCRSCDTEDAHGSVL